MYYPFPWLHINDGWSILNSDPLTVRFEILKCLIGLRLVQEINLIEFVGGSGMRKAKDVVACLNESLIDLGSKDAWCSCILDIGALDWLQEIEISALPVMITRISKFLTDR